MRYGIAFWQINPGQRAEGHSAKITVLPEKAAAVPVTSTAHTASRNQSLTGGYKYYQPSPHYHYNGGRNIFS